MGLMNLFNPAGMLTDKLVEKGQQIASNRSGFLDSIMDKASKVQDFQGSASEHIGAATGMTDLRQSILDQVETIKGREIPEHPGEFKRAGKAKEWMARIGAGLTAAGGNPGAGAAQLANFFNVQDAKAARHEAQIGARQQAIQSRDDDILQTLDRLDTNITGASTAAAGNLLQAGSSLEGQMTQAATAVMQQEASDARQLVDIQANHDTAYQDHINRIEEMDHGAELTKEQINHSAAVSMRNDYNAQASALGLNPAAMQGTINALATGDFEGMTPQDHSRLRMFNDLQKARTDEDLRTKKMEHIARVVGTRVQARDINSGDLLFLNNGDPVTTELSTAKAAMTYMMGDTQAAMDSIIDNPIQAEIDAATKFAEQAGMITPGPMHQFASKGDQAAAARKAEANRISRETGGFPATQDASIEQTGSASPEQLRAQERQLGPLMDQVTKDFDQGRRMLEVVGGLKKAKMSPEIIQSVMRNAMEFGYWDGEEDLADIQRMLQMGPNSQPGAFDLAPNQQ